MPMPMTRPVQVNQTSHTQNVIAKGATPALNLPPSNGVTRPGGAGVVHTVKNPAHQVPTRTRVVPAQVT
jgi:hypothetical protein